MSDTTRRSRRLLLRSAKSLLLVVVLGFVIYALVRQFKQIDFTTLTLRPLPLISAMVCLLGVPIVQLLGYRMLLGAYAHAPPWRVMAGVAWLPPLGKYVPGKIGALVGAVYMLRRFGVSAAVAVSVVLALDGLAVLTGLIVGAPVAWWPEVRAKFPAGPWVIAPFVVAGLVCVHPAVFSRLLNAALRKLKKPPLDHVPDWKHYLGPVACGFAQWACAGVALWLVCNSLGGVPASKLWLCCTISALAMTVSYLALIAPGGIGVREAIYLATLTPLLGPKAAVVAVVMRIIQTSLELLLAGFGWMLVRGIKVEPQHGLATPDVVPVPPT